MSLQNHLIYAARQNEEQLLTFKLLLDNVVAAWRSSAAETTKEGEEEEEKTREVNTSCVNVIDWLLVYRYTGEGADYFGQDATRTDDGLVYNSTRIFFITFIAVPPTPRCPLDLPAHPPPSHQILFCLAGLSNSYKRARLTSSVG